MKPGSRRGEGAAPTVVRQSNTSSPLPSRGPQKGEKSKGTPPPCALRDMGHTSFVVESTLQSGRHGGGPKGPQAWPTVRPSPLKEPKAPEANAVHG